MANIEAEIKICLIIHIFNGMDLIECDLESMLEISDQLTAQRVGLA